MTLSRRRGAATGAAMLLSHACILYMAGFASAFSPMGMSGPSLLRSTATSSPRISGQGLTSLQCLGGKAAPVQPSANSKLDTVKAGITPALAKGLASFSTLYGVASGLPAAFIISLVASSVGFISAVYFVGYGYALSMMALGSLALQHFSAKASQLAVYHASLVIAWGARIFAFLLYREFFAWKQLRQRNKETNKKFAPSAKVSTWMFVAAFYALLFSPTLFHLQTASTIPMLTKAGLGVASVGLLIEAQSDSSKSAHKKSNSEAFMDKGLYSICRHPNYLGEVIFWAGSYMTGVGSLTSPLKWTAASVGLAGIIAIMTQATESLEKKQAIRYAKTAGYAEYVARTPKLIPFTGGDKLSDIVKAAEAATKANNGNKADGKVEPASIPASNKDVKTEGVKTEGVKTEGVKTEGATADAPGGSVSQKAPQETMKIASKDALTNYQKNRKPWDI